MKFRTIGTLSYSQLDIYERCPRLWYERYVLHKKPEAKPQPLCFGIAFHKGMERLLEGWQTESLPIRLNNALSVFDYEYCLGKSRGPDVDTWLPVGQQLIRNYAQILLDRNVTPLPDGIEKRCTRPGFQGYVDCLANVGGQRAIIDWKTASKNYTNARVATHKQVTAYAWMLPDEAWDVLVLCVGVKSSGLVHWHETTRTPQQIEEFGRYVEQIRTEMESTESFIGRHNPAACLAYREQCDMWKMGDCHGLEDF